MHLLLIGLNHKTAPLELRERLAFDADEVGEAVTELAAKAGLYEVVLLSTCNRTELYGTALSVHAHTRMITALAEVAEIGAAGLEGHLYRLMDGDAVKHLYRVAAGLDSLVMGEPQIQGQVRQAYELAHAAQATGARLARLFLSALEVGKNVRSTTALGSTPVSIATIAMQLARRLVGDLDERNVLIVGAGEMCETAAVLAAERQPRRLVLLNRTLERAQRLATLTDGEARPWSDLATELASADVVITGTGASDPIITREMLAAATAGEDRDRILVVDMGVPRDVEAGSEAMDEVFLYTVDDLQQVAEEHLRQRMAAVPDAEAIVDRGQQRYQTWLDSLAVVPTIVDLRGRCEEIRQAQVKQHLTKIQGLDDKGRRRVQQLTQAIVNQILHDPLVRLKHRSTDDTGGVLADSLRYLFALDEDKTDET